MKKLGIGFKFVKAKKNTLSFSVIGIPERGKKVSNWIVFTKHQKLVGFPFKNDVIKTEIDTISIDLLVIFLRRVFSS